MPSTSTVCYAFVLNTYLSFLYGSLGLVCSESSLYLMYPAYTHPLTVRYVFTGWGVAFGLLSITSPWIYWPICQDAFRPTISRWSMSLPVFYSISLAYPLLISLCTEWILGSITSYTLIRALSILPTGVLFTSLLESAGLFSVLRLMILHELAAQHP